MAAIRSTATAVALLNWRAGDNPVRTIDTTIAGFRIQIRQAELALVEPLAGIDQLGFFVRLPRILDK